MSYTTSANYAATAQFKTETKKRTRKKSSKDLIVEKVYSKSLRLSKIEKAAISEILECSPGVFYKPRKICTTFIDAPERWHMIHYSREEFEFWCIYNRIGNPHFDGYDYQEMMNYTSEGMK